MESVDESIGKIFNMVILLFVFRIFDFYLKRDGNNVDRMLQLSKLLEILVNDFYEGYNVYRSENFLFYGNCDLVYKYLEENNVWI